MIVSDLFDSTSIHCLAFQFCLRWPEIQPQSFPVPENNTASDPISLTPYNHRHLPPAIPNLRPSSPPSPPYSRPTIVIGARCLPSISLRPRPRQRLTNTFDLERVGETAHQFQHL